jgi:two-component sensor histidine kinase
MSWRAWLPRESPNGRRAVLLGAALAGAGTAARIALGGVVGDELPFITYFPALILAATLGGVIGGATCLLLATAAAAILFLRGGAVAAWAIGSFWISGGLIIAVAAAMADSVRELRRSRKHLHEAEASLRTLVGELAHRNRNALAVIMSIVSQSARSAASVGETERVINGRLVALARAQEAVLNGQGAAASLRILFETTVAPFGIERFAIAPSPEAEVTHDLALPLGLLFHEMATNALKHGALSVPDGRVEIDWAFESEGVRLHWIEVGGPAVIEPQRQGFGTRLLSAALAPHGGTVERRFEPGGVRCELVIPAKPVERGSGVSPEVSLASGDQSNRLTSRA